MLAQKPDFLGYGEYVKLAMVYADQAKYALAEATLEEYAKRATPPYSLYLPVFQSQIQQMRGDLDGALESYRKAVIELARKGQDSRAGNTLQSFASAATLMGETSAALAFARQQKLHGEELLAVAFLEAVRGDQAAAQRDLQEYATARPWIAPRFMELQRTWNEIVAAIVQGEGRPALDALGRYPDFQITGVLFNRARAHLLVKDYPSAEQEFHNTLRKSHFIDSALPLGQVPLFSLLCHFYLGQTYEATGKNQQAIDEYQSFLAHFEGSRTRLPEVAEARTALSRLTH